VIEVVIQMEVEVVEALRGIGQVQQVSSAQGAKLTMAARETEHRATGAMQKERWLGERRT